LVLRNEEEIMDRIAHPMDRITTPTMKKETTEGGHAGECVAAEALGFLVVATVALSRILFSLRIT
jgi:hypothetical protein